MNPTELEYSDKRKLAVGFKNQLGQLLSQAYYKTDITTGDVRSMDIIAEELRPIVAKLSRWVEMNIG